MPGMMTQCQVNATNNLNDQPVSISFSFGVSLTPLTSPASGATADRVTSARATTSARVTAVGTTPDGNSGSDDGSTPEVGPGTPRAERGVQLLLYASGCILHIST